MALLHEYLWIVVIGAFGAFGFGFGTGSNDVANAFGTSVGAKTLTLKQAVIIAAVFEFAGALLLGRVSTSTIAGGIADVASFAREPEVYAYGMAVTLIVGTVWLLLASRVGLNVSSTHTIIGGIMGFALVYGGLDAVKWATPDKAAFPPYKGVLPIILSWFVSPVLTGCASALIFFTVRTLVLRSPRAYARSFWLLPPFVLLTTWINMYFVFTKGAKKALSSSSDWSDAKAAWISAIIAAGLAGLCAVIVLPLLQFRAKKHFAEADIKEANAQQATIDAAEAGEGQTAVQKGHVAKVVDGEQPAAQAARAPRTFAGALSASKKALGKGLNYDIHKVVETDPIVAAIHANAEVFDPKVEFSFAYLQVFSAICVIFAHGAGEVGYMAGPLGSIWDVYRSGMVNKSVAPPIWIILIGAIGLVAGLALYGYNVTQAMGTQMAKLSPTRGFSAELATALVIMIAAQYGLPTSSSQCITGGIIGVGILEGRAGINWRFFAKQFASWVSTLFVIGLVVGAVFAQGLYAPGKIGGEQMIAYENGVTRVTSAVLTDFNTTLYSVRNASQAGALNQLPFSTWEALNRSVQATASNTKALTDTKKIQSLHPEDAFNLLYRALGIVSNYSVQALGQQTVFPGANACSSNITSAIAANATAACKAIKLLPSGVTAKL